MEYAYGNPNVTGASLGAGTAIGHAIGGSDAAKAVPRTIASAASRIDVLNERLLKVCENLGAISSAIGAMTPVSGLNNAKNTGQIVQGGAVHRLNESVGL